MIMKDGKWGVVLASSGYLNKLLQIWWLKKYILQFWRSEVQHGSYWAQRVSKAKFILEALGQNVLSCLFRLLKAAHTPCLEAPFSHLQNQSYYISLTILPCHIYLSNHNWKRFSLFKEPCK